MVLTLIGLGLFDEKDLSLRAIEEAKNSDKIYIELYTSKWYGDLNNLQKIIGKKIVELKRRDLEENSNNIIEESKKSRIALFVEGDPLMATTHSSLILDARKQGVKTRIIHNTSIISGIGETGLHTYKFGPTVTIPFHEKTKGNPPESIFEIINENKKRGLHTLCLLDVSGEENKYMKINEGLKILLEGGVINENDKIVVFAKTGSGNPVIAYESVSDLIERGMPDIPAVVIVPGKLHFTEKEYLELYE